MMQPHDDGDCAMEEAGALLHSSPLPAVNSKTDASSPSNQQLTNDDALVGARKRKAIRVVKHQQQASSPLKAETEPEEPLVLTSEPTGGNKTGEQGNTSMDTGVSSDLSESRPSLAGEEDEEESQGEESGGEFYRRHSEEDASESNESVSDGQPSRRLRQKNRRTMRQRRDQGRKRPAEELIDDEDHDLRRSCHPIQANNQKKRITIRTDVPAVNGSVGSVDCRANMIHPATLVRPVASASLLPPTTGSKDFSLPDHIPSLDPRSPFVTTPSGRHLNNLFQHDEMLTNPPEEYKNEEDDPFSAVLREMKLKGEFPCRLCEAVFPNLRALKGHNRNHLTHAPYRCNMCPSTSLDKGALIRHMRTHNGERPYECRDCQYAFTTKANCERHLRNRHGKASRDAVKASIVYHLSEDSAANRTLAGDNSDNSGSGYYRGNNNDQSALDLSADREDSVDEEEEFTDYPSEDDGNEEINEQDGPLDLTVDVLDLRKRRQEVTPTKAAPVALPVTTSVQSQQHHPSAPAQPSPPVAPVVSTPVPHSTPADVKPFPSPYFGSHYSGTVASLAGLPFFYPGLGGAPYSAFIESKLVEMGHQNPAVDLSALAIAAAHHDAIRQAQQQQQIQKVQPSHQSAHSLVEGLLMPAVKKYNQDSVENIRPVPMPVSTTPIKMESKKSGNHHSSSSAQAANDPGVKMVLKNGVLVKKQKQRRYRTERPFGCEHCTARFTLRSNMERHIKQQHPDIWSSRPRGHRRSACALTKSAALPTMVDLKGHLVNSMPAIVPQLSQDMKLEGKAPISEQVRQAVQQKLKKRRNSEHSEDEEDYEDEGEEEEEDDGPLVIDIERKEQAPAVQLSSVKAEPTTDLASVSKLLTNAVAQSFQQYFSQHRDPEAEDSVTSDKNNRASPSEGNNTDEMDEGECTSISDGHSMGGSDFGGNRSDSGGGGQAVSITKGKKKSAYSNAPHRVSCPYCARKFPWTSSLRRHILTHTGQKPYKCPQCPLWFTTKSNCDRHLLRKHGNHLRHHSSASTEHGSNNSGSAAGNNAAGPDNSRNVPDRPYKCARCPSSTFATSDNLKKHVDNKHCPAHGGLSSPESITAVDHADSEKAHHHQSSNPVSPSLQAGDGNSAGNEQLPFKCHLCDDSGGYAERQEVLDHLQRDHTEEFHDLVGKVGALVAEPPPMPSAPTSDDGEDYDSVRGKFPDYVNRKVICAFCLRRFWSAEDLRRHMRTHSGERPYQCDVCSRRFTLKHSMLRHRRKHGGSGHAEESEEEEEDCEEEEEEGSVSSDNRQQRRESSRSSAKAKVRMQALWSGSNKSGKSAGGMRLRGPCGSDLIGNLLGIQDTSIVEQLMSKPADDAARLLGVTGGNRV